jgi:hypothetical protein
VSTSVRREDLYRSRSPSESPLDQPATQLLQTRLEKVFGAIVPAPSIDEDSLGHGTKENHVQDEEFEFRLFSKPTGSKATGTEPAGNDLQRINIRTPSPGTENGRFLQPHRPDDYYIVKEASAVTRAQFEIAALSGEDVKRIASQPCVRCSTPSVRLQ